MRHKGDRMIEVGLGARRKVVEIVPEGGALRVSVEGGACQGFQYKFDVVPPGVDESVDDVAVRFDGRSVLVDSTSMPFVEGATVDYVSSLIGERFEVSNPNAVSKCGCGVSFSI